MADEEQLSLETFKLTRSDTMILALVCVLAGIALGFFLPAIGIFASKFPIPFGNVIEKLSAFNQPWVVILRPVIGAILGLVVTFLIWVSTPSLTIADDQIIVDKHDQHPIRISRASFQTAYFDEGKLKILTTGGHESFSGNVEGRKAKIAEAFKTRGYRWGEI